MVTQNMRGSIRPFISSAAYVQVPVFQRAIRHIHNGKLASVEDGGGTQRSLSSALLCVLCSEFSQLIWRTRSRSAVGQFCRRRPKPSRAKPAPAVKTNAPGSGVPRMYATPRKE